MVADIQVVDIGPVGHEHAVPAELLLDPAGQQLVVGVRGDAVDGCGVDHRGQRARLEALLEGTEELLTQVVLGDVGRGAVLAGQRHAVAHEVLDAHRSVLQADMIGVGPLDGDGLHAGHLGLQVRILAPALPVARPAGIAAEVHDRGEHPRHLGGTGLVGHHTAHLEGVVTVEGGAEVDFLRIEGAVREVGGAMDHVQAVKAGNADVLHRAFLDLGDEGGRLLPVQGAVVHHVQDGTHFILAEDDVHLRRIHVVAALRGDDADGKLDHLAGLLLEGHPLEDLFYFCLHIRIGRDGGNHLAGRSAAGSEGDKAQGEG